MRSIPRSTLLAGALLACGCGAREEPRAAPDATVPSGGTVSGQATIGGEQASEAPAMEETRERRVTVGRSEVHLIESGRDEDPCVLLLHGAAFQAKTWLELGTLAHLARASLHAVAIDLPGYGESPESPLAPADFLAELYAALGLERAVIVSPSMSGAFSLPFVTSHPERVAGYVPVAPAAIAPNAASLAGSRVPALILWGGADTTFPVSQAHELAAAFEDVEVVIFEGARHPCYLDDPTRFHDRLADFAVRVSGRAR